MVAVVLAALIFWICVFGIYFTAHGISPVEFFTGAYEPYEPELAKWHAVGADGESGLVREERLLLPDGRERASYLEHQVRHRDPVTRLIVRVEPPRRVPRPRSRSIRGQDG